MIRVNMFDYYLMMIINYYLLVNKMLKKGFEESRPVTARDDMKEIKLKYAT